MTETFDRVLGPLLSGKDGLFSWEWDDHFGAGLSVAHEPDLELVRELLGASFDREWTPEVVDRPQRIEGLARGLGGLRPGQRLYTTDPDGLVMVVGAYWPWQGGETVSLRVGFLAEEVAAADKPGLTEAFKAKLGLV